MELIFDGMDGETDGINGIFLDRIKMIGRKAEEKGLFYPRSQISFRAPIFSVARRLTATSEMPRNLPSVFIKIKIDIDFIQNDPYVGFNNLWKILRSIRSVGSIF
jgi:hypothetical protein